MIAEQFGKRREECLTLGAMRPLLGVLGGAGACSRACGIWRSWVRAYVCSIWDGWLLARCNGCARRSFKMESGPREFIGFVCVSDIGIGWRGVKESKNAARSGGLVVWEVFEEEWSERAGCMCPK